MRANGKQPAKLPRLVVFVSLTLAACNACADQRESAGAIDGTVMSADRLPISYSSYGNGSRSLVLVHGWSCDRRYWSRQVDSLSQRYRIVTVDLGGHGESGLGRDDWTIASFGADVAAVVDSLDLDSVVLVGHSMGGDVIFQAARLLPGKVEALIMVDTYKQLDSGRSDSEIDEFVSQFGADFPAATEKFVRSVFPASADPALVDWVATEMASAPPDVALSAIRSSFRHAREIPSLIRSLEVPIVAINPDDAPTDLDSMSKFGIDVKIMRGVGHFLMMEDPDRFNELLLEAVDEVD